MTSVRHLSCLFISPLYAVIYSLVAGSLGNLCLRHLAVRAVVTLPWDLAVCMDFEPLSTPAPGYLLTTMWPHKRDCFLVLNSSPSPTFFHKHSKQVVSRWLGDRNVCGAWPIPLRESPHIFIAVLLCVFSVVLHQIPYANLRFYTSIQRPWNEMMFVLIWKETADSYPKA